MTFEDTLGTAWEPVREERAPWAERFKLGMTDSVTASIEWPRRLRRAMRWKSRHLLPTNPLERHGKFLLWFANMLRTLWIVAMFITAVGSALVWDYNHDPLVWLEALISYGAIAAVIYFENDLRSKGSNSVQESRPHVVPGRHHYYNPNRMHVRVFSNGRSFTFRPQPEEVSSV